MIFFIRNRRLFCLFPDVPPTPLVKPDPNDKKRKKKKMFEKPKAFVYCRVSASKNSLPRESDKLLSLDNQALLCVEWCRENGFDPIRVIHEIGTARDVKVNAKDERSTRKRKRAAQVIQPQWEQMMTELEAGTYGTKIPTVVVYNATRFCRSVSRGLGQLERLQKCGASLHLVQEGLAPLKDDAQRFQLINLLNLAELESKRISERVESIIRLRREFGHRFGPPAYGQSVLDLPLDAEESTALDQINLLTATTELLTDNVPVKKTKRIFIVDAKERSVIDLIGAMRTTGTKVSTLNSLLLACTPTSEQKEFQELELCGGKKRNRFALAHPLSCGNIAAVLNEYGIPYRRGRAWTTAAVRMIAQRHAPHGSKIKATIKSVEPKPSDLDEFEIIDG